MFNLIFILVFSFIYLSAGSGESLACGDWEPYKDEHCFKIFSLVGLLDFDGAVSTCQGNGSHLIIIRYAEEQTFLNNFLFKKNQIIDNVWIDGRFDDATSKYTWKDGSQMTYTNWATNQPKNHPNYCVQMQSEEEVLGKWTTEPCAKKNAVICQKPQLWTKDTLVETVRELKHSLLEMQMKQSQAEMELIQKLNQTEVKLVETKQRLSQTEAKLTQRLNQTELELKQTKQNLIPIGFTYVQLAKDKAPKEIWPSMTWTDVSANYAGLFFRVEGGQSAAFGTVQEANQTGISNVHVGYENPAIATGQSTSLEAGTWSKTIGTAGKNGGVWYYWQLYTTAGETRPRNMAMRVWRRTV